MSDTQILNWLIVHLILRYVVEKEQYYTALNFIKIINISILKILVYQPKYL